MLPQDIGLPLHVPGTWTLELSASTAVGTQPGASTTFLVENADGTQPSVPGAATGTTLPGVPVVGHGRRPDEHAGPVRHHRATDDPPRAPPATDRAGRLDTVGRP